MGVAQQPTEPVICTIIAQNGERVQVKATSTHTRWHTDDFELCAFVANAACAVLFTAVALHWYPPPTPLKFGSIWAVLLGSVTMLWVLGAWTRDNRLRVASGLTGAVTWVGLVFDMAMSAHSTIGWVFMPMMVFMFGRIYLVASQKKAAAKD